MRVSVLEREISSASVESFAAQGRTAPGPETGPVLEVCGLSVSYPTVSGFVAALKDISFSLAAGETLALVGESGSGKSTAALAVLDYLPHGARREARGLHLMGQDLMALRPSALRALRGRRITAVSQHPGTSLNPAMTIGAQLTEVSRHVLGLSRAASHARALALLGEVQIRNPGQVAGLYPHQLSGGMQQRVAIAIALAPEPDLIVLDEPTTALDATVQREILELLADLQQRRGTAYLLISHDLRLVSGFADRIAVMRGGEILETGSVLHLTETPAHDYTRHLLASALVPASGRQTAAVATPPLLRVSGLGHSFRNASTSVLQEISFDIAPGRCLGLIGESGSGKSTIGKLICGIHDLQDGRIEMAGSDLPAAGDARSLAQRNLVRMVFQSPDATLNPAHRVGDILKRAAHLAGSPDPGARMRELFDLVRLPPELASRFPAGLSGGQKQRVAIARAFASSPKLVVLDEPTSALDATVQKEVLSLLQELQHREQVAFLLITHDLSILPGMADDLVVLKDGRIVEKGPQDQVLNAPCHAYTRALIEAGNSIF